MRPTAVIAVAAALMCTAPAVGAAKPFRFGLNDVPEAHSDEARALALHTRLGATVQRIGLPWRLVQPSPGAFDWSFPDRTYRSATTAGMRPIFVVSSTPAWAATNTYTPQCFLKPDAQFCQRPPAAEHIGDLADFLAAVARRYSKLAAIEIVNEPNLGNFNWQPRADPEGYVPVLRAAHAAVKGARPGLPVISGGITGPPVPPEEGMMQPVEFLERMYAAGARGAMDGIGVHPYPGPRAPADPQGAFALIGAVRAIRDRHGDAGLPLWLTETGYPTLGDQGVSLELQAEWLPDLVDRLLRQPDVAAVVVNTLADQYGESFGLAFADLSLKPVFEPLRRRIAEIVERRTAAACRCSRKAKRCARRHSRSPRCRKARRRCRCIRRWRSCVRRGSDTKRCRRAERCAHCRAVTAAGACRPKPARAQR